MKMLVTGAGGFIGSRLSAELLRAGHEVTCLDRASADDGSRLRHTRLGLLGEHPAATCVRADIASEPLDQWVHAADVVFHLAGLPGVRDSWDQRFSSYLEANVLGSQRVIESAASSPRRPRVVLASSSSIYGEQPSMPVREDASPAPKSPYGVTKLAMEHLARAYRIDTGVDAVSARLFTVCGPGQRPDMAISRLFAAATSGPPFIITNPSWTRDYTHVDDAVRALTALATSAALTQGAYNVSGGNRVSLTDVIAAVTETVGNAPEVLRGGDGRGDPQHTWADTSALTRDTNWRATLSIQQAIRDHWSDRDGLISLESLAESARS